MHFLKLLIVKEQSVFASPSFPRFGFDLICDLSSSHDLIALGCNSMLICGLLLTSLALCIWNVTRILICNLIARLFFFSSFFPCITFYILSGWILCIQLLLFGKSKNETFNSLGSLPLLLHTCILAISRVTQKRMDFLLSLVSCFQLVSASAVLPCRCHLWLAH